MREIYKVTTIKPHKIVDKFAKIKDVPHKNIFNSLNHPFSATAYGYYWLYKDEYEQWLEVNG